MINFIGEDIAARAAAAFPHYPKEFVLSTGNPSMGGLAGTRVEMNGFPAIYNIEADPREEVNILADHGWMIGQYLKIIAEYQKTLEKYPNPKAVKLTEFGK